MRNKSAVLMHMFKADGECSGAAALAFGHYEKRRPASRKAVPRKRVGGSPKRRGPMQV